MNKQNSHIEKKLLLRLYGAFVLLLVFAFAVVYKTFAIQFIQGNELRNKFKAQTIDLKNIEAVRGNIYATNGSILATSVPIYEIRFDTQTDGLKKDTFYKHVDSLAINLAGLFADKNAKQYKKQLITAYKKGARFHLIHRRVSYNQLQKLKKFPIFRRGRYNGGFVYLKQNKRKKPFGMLSARTVGYKKEDRSVGLEAAYQKELSGIGGKRLMKKISGGTWMPINDENEIDPQDGYDIYTAIDINIQDVAHQALEQQLKKQNADHGSVVLMEVKTGDIKAIANLSRNKNGSYSEKYNYAIGESTEPGSTIKLASLAVALEDGLVKPTDSIETGDGKLKFFDRTLRDSKHGGYGKITIQRGFEVSSNIAIAKCINDNYGNNPDKFIEGLRRMSLDKSLGVEIPGEGKPFIKTTTDKDWSGISLPWISYGYESKLTPLQILTFYNAVANGGKMVKPRFVHSIKEQDEVIKNIEIEVLNESICSKKTISQLNELLKGVVNNGTAKNLKNSVFPIAGKTGTALIYNSAYGYRYDSKVSYQASFVGYFPADNPKYSCIVVVNAPSNNVYYGNLVAGPIFKEVADKIYATSIDIHPSLSEINKNFLPNLKKTKSNDISKLLLTLNVNTQETIGNEWIIPYKSDTSNFKIKKISFKETETPNVVGMSLKDALYLLETRGYHVSFSGNGQVTSQSVNPGSPIDETRKISLKLS